MLSVGRVASTRLLVMSLSLLASSTACLPSIRKDPLLPKDEKIPTTIVSVVVRAIPEDGKSADLLDLLQNTSLEKFGLEALPRVEEVLRTHGFEPTLDPDVVRSLPRAGGLVPEDAVTALTGVWRHSDAPLIPAASWAFGDARSDVWGGRMMDSSLKFPMNATFVEVIVQDATDCGAMGLNLWRHPNVYVRALTFNADGKPIFIARSRGGGDGSPFVVNRSPENLQKAVEAGFKELAKAEVATF
jgi:hypothetical protein